MKLYIRIKDNQPYKNPITKKNMKEAFPEVDLDNLPEGWAKFEKVPRPLLTSPYQTASSEYGWDGDIVKDIWTIKEISQEEKIRMQEEVKQNWKNSLNFEGWTFDETICGFVPPVPQPDDGYPYTWSIKTNNWIRVDENLSRDDVHPSLLDLYFNTNFIEESTKTNNQQTSKTDSELTPQRDCVRQSLYILLEKVVNFHNY